MKRTLLLLGCAVALTVTADAPLASAQESSGGTTITTSGDAKPAAKPASRQLRRRYAQWRRKLIRYGAFVGRNLLRAYAPADRAGRPTARQLRRSIHRMQRRWARYRQTARGRAAIFRVKVRRTPSWAKGALARIAWCESRNNLRAVGGGGAYRGLYQFSFSTWRVVGGSGDPAAASRWEQTWRAWLLLKRHGSGHWPVCG